MARRRAGGLASGCAKAASPWAAPRMVSAAFSCAHARACDEPSDLCISRMPPRPPAAARRVAIFSAAGGLRLPRPRPEEQSVVSVSQDAVRVYPIDNMSVAQDTTEVDWKTLQDPAASRALRS